MPIEHVTGWLYRVARNAVTDLFRKTRPGRFSDPPATDPEGEPSAIEELVPSAEPGPDALLRSSLLLEELELALAELPEEQRFVFVAHELEGRTFKDLSAETGANVNTLLARKRYAVLHLRNRLREFHDETTEE
jgi:RNA polymerase sigma factor (sigma-70 family)